MTFYLKDNTGQMAALECFGVIRTRYTCSYYFWHELDVTIEIILLYLHSYLQLVKGSKLSGVYIFLKNSPIENLTVQLLTQKQFS